MGSEMLKFDWPGLYFDNNMTASLTKPGLNYLI